MDKTFHYQGAFRDYIKQFLRIFSGFYVEFGVDDDNNGVNNRRKCVVHYGDMDRTVANILHTDGVFVPNVLPIMTGVETSIEMNPEIRRNKYHEDNVSRVRGTDGKTVSTQRKMGVPYMLNMDLSILASNKTQMFQLLEQILMMFTPKLVLQKSENLIDWTYITEIELLSVAPDSNIPMGTEERFVAYTLSFAIDVWLDYPAKEDDGIIKEITMNILDNTFDSDGALLDTFKVDANVPFELDGHIFDDPELDEGMILQ